MTDITLALAEKPLADICKAFVDIFQFDKTKTIGNDVKFSLHFGGHLGNGTVSIQPPNSNPRFPGAYIRIWKLEVYWDTLEFTASVYIPPVKVGGFCLLPTPWGCAIYVDAVTFFGTDVSGTVDISGIVRSQLSTGFVPKYDSRDQPASTL
jgi:hypothetical protein